MTASTDPSPESYAITGGEQGKRRLDLLSEIMRPTTLRLLAEAGLLGGDRCLDLGCGGGNVTLDMARIVGPGGLVTGVDFDAQLVELARQDATGAGVSNVEYHAADACTFDGGPFDLIYARFLLSHLSQPGTILARMRQLARPGARIVVEDTDMSGWGNRVKAERRPGGRLLPEPARVRAGEHPVHHRYRPARTWQRSP